MVRPCTSGAFQGYRGNDDEVGESGLPGVDDLVLGVERRVDNASPGNGNRLSPRDSELALSTLQPPPRVLHIFGQSSAPGFLAA